MSGARSSMARVILLAAVSAAGAPALAEPGSRQTRNFVQAAAQSDHFEALSAATALAESRNPKIRAFAARMIRDHERTSTALADAAARSSLRPPPPGIGSDQGSTLGALQGLRGEAFDRGYARQQALSHRSALVTEQGYATSGDDPAVRRAAAAAVPIVSAHLAAAERLVAELGPAS